MVHFVNKINIRDVWKNEAADFNEWLFKKENLEYLGRELGLQLLPFRKEKKVNKGRVDIIAVNLIDDSYVLIENQIGKADHHHYGKIIDYIYSLKPKTTIWIINEWHSFHRNTIKILEDITQLFVVKVELFKIANSPVGVKFTSIIEPANWTKKYFITEKMLPPTNVGVKKNSATDVFSDVFHKWIESSLSNQTFVLNQWIVKRFLLESIKEYFGKNASQIPSSKAIYNLFKSHCEKNNLRFQSRKSGGTEFYFFEAL